MVVAWNENTSKAIKKQVDSLFYEYLDVSCYSLKQWMRSNVDSDLVLVSTGVFANQVASKVKPGTKIIIIRRTLMKQGWNKIVSLTPGKKYMLVNDGRDFAIETISLLYELGARYIELIPVFPGIKEIPNIESAITPGEIDFVPESVKEVIDIGDRVVDVSSYIDILSHFNLLNLSEVSSILASYTEKIIPRSQGMQDTMKNLINIKSLIQQTLDIVQEGVITYDERGIVTNINKEAENIIGSCAWDVIGRELKTIIKDEMFTTLFQSNDVIKDALINIRRQNIICNKVSIKTDGKYTGGVLSLQVATKVKELELKLRSQLRTTGHEAKYSFSHLVSKSEKMNQIIRHAQQISDSDLNVLITGESGTGKELFAHAIHNSSPRKRYPFVVVNCSALPDSLLESELFGYEEGAFTGAKRGGKQGFFEQAHNGSIFLDEIGDISQKLQSRLLRVIQQKEVLKVGGTKILPINVRVIAATNRNLLQMVKEGKFRDDLFYRLKVAQIEIVPLRERKEDIPYLVSSFLERENYKGKVSREVMDLLEKYDWQGNVRELENTITYLATINRDSPEIKNTTFVNEYFEKLWATKEEKKAVQYISDRIDISSAVIPPEFLEIDLNKYVLQEIYKAKEKGENIGRRSLVKLAKEKGLILSENKVRNIIEDLTKNGFIEVLRGREGCKLTRKGYLSLNK